MGINDLEQKALISKQLEMAREFLDISEEPSGIFSSAPAVSFSQAIYASKIQDRDALKQLLDEYDEKFSEEYCVVANKKINNKNQFGDAALHSFAGSKNMVDLLLDKGADPNIKNSEGKTPIILAATKKRLSSVKILHYAGADLKVTDNKGNNILANLVKDHAPDVGRDLSKEIKYFIKHGVDPNQKNFEGKSALDLAKESPYKNSLPILLQRSQSRGISR